MENNINFQNAVNELKHMNIELHKEDSCILYGLYNQSLFGDNNYSKPNFLDYNDRKKWYSWNRYKGLSKEAKRRYINYVNLLKMIHKFD